MINEGDADGFFFYYEKTKKRVTFLQASVFRSVTRCGSIILDYEKVRTVGAFLYSEFFTLIQNMKREDPPPPLPPLLQIINYFSSDLEDYFSRNKFF
jgi:hypothetical protein